jgi:hypothetical protein
MSPAGQSVFAQSICGDVEETHHYAFLLECDCFCLRAFAARKKQLKLRRVERLQGKSGGEITMSPAKAAAGPFPTAIRMKDQETPGFTNYKTLPRADLRPAVR